MRLELSDADALFLRDHLSRELERIDTELVHTDKRAMQRDLAEDARRLRTIIEQMFGPGDKPRPSVS